MNKATFSVHNKIELIRNGHDFIEINIELIKKAQTRIMLHTYIFEDDEVTNYIIEELAIAATRGVDVYLIVDAIGSSELSRSCISKLKLAGVRISLYKPVYSLKGIAHRLHQKILLIDMSDCLLGGINISKKYNSPRSENPWLDYSCHFQGEEIERTFNKIKKLYIQNFPDFDSKQVTPLIESEYNHYSTPLRTVTNNWIKRNQQIHYGHMKSIKNAKKEINILATYFLPGKHLLKSLAAASQRGVVVNLFFGQESDQKLAAKASEYFYRWYLSKGMNVYIWNHSIVHGKVCLIDDQWVSLGSYNHNFISRYGNKEINLEINESLFATKMKKEFIHIKQKSQEISVLELSRKSGFMNEIVLRLTFLLLNVLTLLALLTIYQQDRK